MKIFPAPVWRQHVGLNVVLFSFAALPFLPAQDTSNAARSAAGTDVFPATNAASTTSVRRDAVSRIREEGLERSQVMETLSYLTDAIGPRLTGSPNMKRANEWTRDKLTSWGISDARLEPWGPFGRGWSVKRFSMQIVEPHTIPLAANPKAWSPGLEQPVVADVVYLDARTEADLEKYKGKLKGAVVLTAPVRAVNPRYEPLATRLAETNLLRLANASATRGGGARRGGQAFARGGDGNASTNAPGRAGGPGARGGGRGGAGLGGRALSFCLAEGAALTITPSGTGDGGTVFVTSVALPGAAGRGGGGGGTDAPRYYSTNAPAMPPQVMMAVEDYNRLVRMIQLGEKPKMAVEFQVQYHDDDLMAYNTIAEIPGTDLKDEVVMIGGHMDSWHVGTGATDNAAGVAAAMEALRIIKTLDLKPRRTIRIGLWSGEEQGLLGSRAYVTQHFGYDTNTPPPEPLRSPRAASQEPANDSSSSTNTVVRRVRKKEFEKLSVYFNVDNGAGKIRGVYLQGNEAVRPLFRSWLEPFNDLGADTLTLSNTGSTDHVSFDSIGLPGFQFIQDPLEYNTRTHHSNADVYDRVPPEDLKQIATIFAAFAYNAAMLDEKLPRKPTTP